MFVFGACWAVGPPQHVFGDLSLSFGQCNVKTPRSMGAEHEMYNQVIGLSALIFVLQCIVISAYPWFADHGIV